MATQSKTYKTNGSSRTVVRSFRITYTQDALLDREQLSNRASAIIRTLLSLYFNKKIKDVEALIDKEVQEAEVAKAQRIERRKLGL